VEAALIGNPFIAVYRLSRLSYAVASRLVRLPHVAMPNLIAGRRVVPELIQDEFTPENVVQALRPLLEDGGAERASMIAGLGEVRDALRIAGTGETAIDRAADWVARFAGEQQMPLPNRRIP
jgi:lipid-A-disaccharide synthase